MAHEQTGAHELRDSDLTMRPDSVWRMLWIASTVVGVLGLIALYLLKGRIPVKHLYYSYLVSFVFWLSLVLGGMLFTLIQYAVRAGWSVVVRRLAENMMWPAMLVMAILFVPIATGGMHHLYGEWMHAAHEAHGGESAAHSEGNAEHEQSASKSDHSGDDSGEATNAPAPTDHHERQHHEILAGKTGYLNVPFFLVRAVLYFVVWIVLCWFFHRNSTLQDKDGDHQRTRRMQLVSNPAIALYAITMTFAMFDWLMSLDPAWYSTIWGPYYFSGSFLATFAFLSLVSIGLRQSGMLSNVITVEHYHDLGKLIFAFTVFWTYIAFSQYFLYWYGNIPEETAFYAHRLVPGWKPLSLVLMFGHFVFPFFFMMSRHIKRNVRTLAFGAAWVLVLHYIDMYWLVMPNAFPEGPEFGIAGRDRICRHRRAHPGLFLLSVATATPWCRRGIHDCRSRCPSRTFSEVTR